MQAQERLVFDALSKQFYYKPKPSGEHVVQAADPGDEEEDEDRYEDGALPPLLPSGYLHAVFSYHAPRPRAICGYGACTNDADYHLVPIWHQRAELPGFDRGYAMCAEHRSGRWLVEALVDYGTRWYRYLSRPEGEDHGYRADGPS